MRELKFRAWNGLEMIYFDLFDAQYGGYPIMQYTGLKDCIGQEIYEGDLLHFLEPDLIYEVFFDEGAFRIMSGEDDESIVLTNKILDANYDVRVIGNIHQNPELLE